MPNCAAYSCFNNTRKKKEGVTYHRFPKDPDLRDKWTQAVKRLNWTPSNYSYLCSEHFLERDFDRSSEHKVRLREGVVPTNFPGNNKKFIVERRQIKRKIDGEPSTSVTESNETAKDISATGLCPTTKKMKVADNNLSSTILENHQSPGKTKLKCDLKKTKAQLFAIRKKVRKLNQNKRRLKKKVANLEIICKTLQEKLNIQEESCELLSSLSKTSECLVKRAIQKAKNPKMKKVYEDRLKAFAITLHFISPKAYTFVRSTFNTALPNPRTLARWYSCVQGEPGFSSEVLRALKEYADKSKTPVICSLMVDSMAIRKHLEWDGKRFHGTVNVGSASPDDSSTLASEVLVFNLVFVNSAWKIPIGYFFTSGVSGQQLAGLVKQCLTLVGDTGVIVGSLTADGTSTNISMANLLGCKITKDDMVTFFPHPSTGQKVHFFLDACHMLKLVRNTFGDYEILLDDRNEKIDWTYVKKLQALQEEMELRFANKLTKEHVQYWKQKMKVKLAAQVLSSSVADALEYLQVNKFPGFEGCASTIRFIRTFNKLFDLLNSRSIRAKGDKKALCSYNFESHFASFDKCWKYIEGLKTADNKRTPILKTRRKTGFLGFLVCLKSAKEMFEQFVGCDPENNDDKLLKYLPLYKMSQDHLERLFGYIRSRGGCNNNPTSRQFTGTFKRLLLHSELHEGSKGNAEVLDRSLMFKVCRRSSTLNEINSSSLEWRMLEDREREVALDNPNEDEEDSNDSLISNTITDQNLQCDVESDIVEYIAGYVVRSLQRKLFCEKCAGELVVVTSRDNSLIACKNRGGLVNPSAATTKICKLSEKVLRGELAAKNIVENNNLMRKMKMSVFKACIGLNLFGNNEHFVDVDFETSHFFLLIEVISKTYFNIRLKYHCKVENEKNHQTRFRNDLCKKILFAGQ